MSPRLEDVSEFELVFVWIVLIDLIDRVDIPYVITTKTGKKQGAGTDADVFIQFYGKEGKSEEYVLKNSSDNFEKGKVSSHLVFVKYEPEPKCWLLFVFIGRCVQDRRGRCGSDLQSKNRP